MNGVEYYLGGEHRLPSPPSFEGQALPRRVLGQMYGSLYSQYNIYR
jgi:hypothetical protein